ncbi:hypothetical protein LJC49_02030 [Ruminococcaceae bacterium OttesenSCG-928-I18]|nr:hypothetical protein [Ruminococcaceae bacterium OttesenSCG-928-I18]
MFSIGDKIIYGSTGVCTVTDIGMPDIPGATRECYVLKPHYMANSKIYAPIEDNPVNMRPLLTREQAQTLIDSMPEMQTFAADSDRQALYNTYRGAIRSADSVGLARLLKTLHEKKCRLHQQRKNVPSAEKEFFDTAEKILHGEIADALQIPFEEVSHYISARLEGGYVKSEAVVS